MNKPKMERKRHKGPILFRCAWSDAAGRILSFLQMTYIYNYYIDLYLDAAAAEMLPSFFMMLRIFDAKRGKTKSEETEMCLLHVPVPLQNNGLSVFQTRDKPS